MRRDTETARRKKKNKLLIIPLIVILLFNIWWILSGYRELLLLFNVILISPYGYGIYTGVKSMEYDMADVLEEMGHTWWDYLDARDKLYNKEEEYFKHK